MPSPKYSTKDEVVRSCLSRPKHATADVSLAARYWQLARMI
ncbi:MAG: hypothetical protein ABII90_08505 [Bacteroidota bacterium]